tara:strand:- start:1 stop:441 length:441 start_codon:yes stop_codon:yes gene_type:complete
MPGFEITNSLQNNIWNDYKDKINNHKSYHIKNKYFKENKMEEWDNELKRITYNMREKMRQAITYAKIVENQEKKMKVGIETAKNIIKQEKIKETCKKNKEMNPTRRSKRIKEQNELEIIAIKSFEQVLKEKMEKAIEKGDYIDLTI